MPRDKKYPLKRIDVRLDHIIYTRLCEACEREKSTLTDMVGEAITYWIRFLAEDAAEKCKKREKEDKLKMLQEAEKIWLYANEQRRILGPRHAEQIRKLVRNFSKTSWERLHPGTPWVRPRHKREPDPPPAT
jgi:hypothetical protein